MHVISRHESASGFYRVSTYFLAKVFCDIIPMRVVPLCVYSLIIYFMAGQSVIVVSYRSRYVIGSSRYKRILLSLIGADSEGAMDWGERSGGKRFLTGRQFTTKCILWLLESTEIRFRLGLHPGPRWRSSRRSPESRLLIIWEGGTPLPNPHPCRRLWRLS